MENIRKDIKDCAQKWMPKFVGSLRVSIPVMNYVWEEVAVLEMFRRKRRTDDLKFYGVKWTYQEDKKEKKDDD